MWELEGGEDADAKDGADTTYDDAVPNGFFEAEIVIIDVEDLERWGTLAYVPENNSNVRSKVGSLRWSR